ncbi:hypothetical protein BGX38DRAFT_1272009 [Terfezia claveryi]|nr:hypothetical protein BGX38DRAFT_1272009 [Terfezia claveryi]
MTWGTGAASTVGSTTSPLGAFTADISCITNLVSRILDIEVGGGRTLRSLYAGSVRLSMVIAGLEVPFVLDPPRNANAEPQRRQEIISPSSALDSDALEQIC